MNVNHHFFTYVVVLVLQCQCSKQEKSALVAIPAWVFRSWSKCSYHLWTAHRIDTEDLLACPHCSEFKTNTRHKLEIHMEVHSEVRKYACSACSKRFKQLAQVLSLMQPYSVHNFMALSTANENVSCTQYVRCEKTILVGCKYVQ